MKMAEMPKVETFEYVTSRRATFRDPVFDITWFLTYTGTLFFCVGGAGLHEWLLHEKVEAIPKPPPPHESSSKKKSIVAAGRIKDVQGVEWKRHYLWGSTFIGVETPRDWRPALQEILEQQVIPQVIADS
ncbi:MAG: hypothetical protein RIQ41_471 [Candidatus Parcubacteria bacterium]|jgi:hypothetical protein